MIVYACMCEQTLACEYVIILTSSIGAMQFSLSRRAFAVFQIIMHIFDLLIRWHVLLTATQ